MGGVFMSVDITYYGPGLTPMCRFYEILNDEPCTSRKLSLEEAHRLMWELVLAGATKEYHSNQYDPSIHTVSAQYYARR